MRLDGLTTIRHCHIPFGIYFNYGLRKRRQEANRQIAESRYIISTEQSNKRMEKMEPNLTFTAQGIHQMSY